MPLVRRLASRYRGGREPLEDLVQVASLGLVKALDRFDPERGVAFTTYAAPTILGELRRHFRDRGWSVHVPRDLQERTAAVEKAVAEHADEARPRALGPRDRRPPAALRGRRARGDGGRRRSPRRLDRRPAADGGLRGRADGRAPRRRATRASRPSSTAPRSSRCSRSSPSATAWSSTCASSRT